VDRFGNTSAASVPLALAEAVDTGRVRMGDRIVFVAFGAGFTSGAVALEWSADPANGARAAAIDPEAIRVRLPVDLDSVDPIPAQLAAVLAARPDVPSTTWCRRSGAARAAVSSPTTTDSPRRSRTIDLTGRVAIVTSGSRGINRAVSLMLAARASQPSSTGPHA
jgi:hypothetical protein